MDDEEEVESPEERQRRVVQNEEMKQTMFNRINRNNQNVHIVIKVN